MQRVIARDTAGMARYRLVRYEDLVGRSSWRGFRPDGVGRDSPCEGRPRRDRAAGRRAGGAVHRARVAGRAHQLDEQEMAAVLVLAGAELVRLGYLTEAS